VATEESVWELPTGDNVRVIDKTVAEKSEGNPRAAEVTEVKDEKAR
jgi:hypothetical protein